jgi:SAM-dependent methyltransferase
MPKREPGLARRARNAGPTPVCAPQPEREARAAPGVYEAELPPLAAGQTLIGLFDVLEHIDDDGKTLRWIWSVLRPGGVLVLTVPAHPFLFDEMDELAHHRRRYRRRELGEKLRSAGFEVRVLQHFMVSLVPMLAALRRLGRLLPLRSRSAHARRDAELRIVPGVNAIMVGLLRLERRLGRRVPLPFGSSLVAVAARPSGGQARP